MLKYALFESASRLNAKYPPEQRRAFFSSGRQLTSPYRASMVSDSYALTHESLTYFRYSVMKYVYSMRVMHYVIVHFVTLLTYDDTDASQHFNNFRHEHES